MLNSILKLICNLKSTSASKNIKTKVNYSKKNLMILQYLLNYKLILNFKIICIKNNRYILIFLNLKSLYYLNKIKIFSTNSLKKYISKKNIIKLNSNNYFGIISTPIGLITLNEAAIKQISGTLIFLIK